MKNNIFREKNNHNGIEPTIILAIFRAILNEEKIQKPRQSTCSKEAPLQEINRKEQYLPSL